MDVIEVLEHQEIDIAIDRLVSGGELALDRRISQRGYLTVAIAHGRLRLKSTRFVGLIPLNRDLAVRIKPAASIANLTQMIVRAGSVPTVIEDFARGYKPLFEQSAQAIELHHTSFLAAVDRIMRRGLLKHYIRMENPPNWRGRFLAARTVNRYIARGIRYAAVFDFTTLSHDVDENRIIKAALHEVVDWLAKSQLPARRNTLLHAKALMQELRGVSELKGPVWRLIADVPRMARFLPLHYSGALWMAYAILQRAIPDVVKEGYVSLDSMIVDISAVFESYVRTVISESASDHGLVVKDGNRLPSPFFASGDSVYQVKPDILIERSGQVKAVFDVKYKPKVNERDRYELLSFMEATGAEHAAFICPKAVDGDPSRFLGTTPGGKSMGIIRVDLAAGAMTAEEDKMVKSILKVVDGRYDFGGANSPFAVPPRV